MLREDIVDNRLKGDVRRYDIDVIEDEILIGIWWALHDTGIYVPSRDDNSLIDLPLESWFVLMNWFDICENTLEELWS